MLLLSGVAVIFGIRVEIQITVELKSTIQRKNGKFTNHSNTCFTKMTMTIKNMSLH